MGTSGEHQDPTARVLRQLEKERERTEWLLTTLMWHSQALARIEHRLAVIEGSTLTAAQMAKILAGLLLPLGALVLTGNAELARQLMLP